MLLYEARTIGKHMCAVHGPNCFPAHAYHGPGLKEQSCKFWNKTIFRNLCPENTIK